MSIALKQDVASISHLASPHRTQALIAASNIQPDDRVMVIGRAAVDHLLVLARTGCRTATAIRSHKLCRAGEPADVVWLTDVAAIDAETAAAIDSLDSPRVVAIDLTRDCAKAALLTVTEQLRAKGLVDQAIHKVAGRTVVVAARPAWLRRVI